MTFFSLAVGPSCLVQFMFGYLLVYLPTYRDIHINIADSPLQVQVCVMVLKIVMDEHWPGLNVREPCVCGRPH